MILTNWLCPAGAARYTVNQAGVNSSYSCSKATVLWYEVDSVQRMDYKLSFFSLQDYGILKLSLSSRKLLEKTVAHCLGLCDILNSYLSPGHFYHLRGSEADYLHI